MTKLFDLCVATRRYTDSSGNNKTVWENVGSILNNDEGRHFMMLKAHFNPAGISRKEGSESILVSMFKPKDSTADYTSFGGFGSSSSKLFDLCVATRKYSSNGQDKTAWENIGSILSGENNPYMMLKAHFNPAAIQRKEGSECILVSMFTPKSKDSSTDVQDFSNAQDFTASTDFSPESFNPDEIPF